MYIGKHTNPEEAVEVFNENMKAYIDLYYEQIFNCGFNPERVRCWNELVKEFREYRVLIIKMLYQKGVKTAILEANGKYSLVGPESNKKEERKCIPLLFRLNS